MIVRSSLALRSCLRRAFRMACAPTSARIGVEFLGSSDNWIVVLSAEARFDRLLNTLSSLYTYLFIDIIYITVAYFENSFKSILTENNIF